MSTIKVRIRGINQRVRDAPSDWGKPAGFYIEGTEVPFESLTVGDLTDRIAEVEAYLSRITGMEVKIETASE